MTQLRTLLLLPILSITLAAAPTALDDAEVRLPYAELKRLLADAARPEPADSPLASLLAARLRISMDAGNPVVDATFSTASFGNGLVMVPLIGGNLTMNARKPADTGVVIRDGMLCQVLTDAGKVELTTRLLPISNPAGFELIIPASPSSILETGTLGTDGAIALRIDGHDQILGPNQLLPLPLAGATVGVRILNNEETHEALRPPEPSTWTWQHQALVVPGDGALSYHLIARASANGGSGVAADLTLPPDACEITVTGADLASQKPVRGADRSLSLNLTWKTRGILERVVEITYQMPRRPLDRKWSLQSPSGPVAGSTRTRFIIASSATLAYAAAELTGPFEPDGLPDVFKSLLKGDSCFHLEGGDAADLTINPLPLVATADGSMPTAVWSVKIEPDGAMLMKGVMTVAHRKRVAVTFDTPVGMTLLSCQVGDKAVAPVQLNDGLLEVTLPGADGTSVIHCAFTGRTEALDPVEGTLALALPKTPLFIDALNWNIDLPSGYMAESNGNLTRMSNPKDAVRSQIALRKNLCRNERPEVRVFYRRADLDR